jgi:hypothetical protein
MTDGIKLQGILQVGRRVRERMRILKIMESKRVKSAQPQRYQLFIGATRSSRLVDEWDNIDSCTNEHLVGQTKPGSYRTTILSRMEV